MPRAIPSRRGAVLTALAGLAAAALAAPPAAIVASRAWTRPAMAGMNAAGYVTLANRGRAADRLTGTASADAARVSIHVSRQIGAVMTMRPVAALDIPAGGSVTLAPGGYHLMLEGLKRPLRSGDKIAVQLHFARAGNMKVSLVVVAGAAMMPRMPM
jgi:hypothetical protein